MAIYVALYDVKRGGAARGFQCVECSRVTRTERGMHAHLWQVHHVKIQIKMFTDQTIKPTPSLQALCDPPENQTARTRDKTL